MPATRARPAANTTPVNLAKAARAQAKKKAEKAKDGTSRKAEKPPRQRRTRAAEQIEPGVLNDTSSSEEQPQVIADGGANSASSATSADSTVSQQLVNVFEKVLQSVRDGSMSGSNVHMMNRMTTAKNLPSFSGNPLEWLNFKEVYELTTELGAYSDRDNIARLFTALKGEAREVVGMLLATNRDPKAIMQTLDLHYGNKRVLAERVRADILDLPRLDSKKLSLVQFATRIRNAISTFRAHGLKGNLYDSELTRTVGSKIPYALKLAYAQFVFEKKKEDGEEVSELELLSMFLFEEAERTSKTVLFDAEATVKLGERSFGSKHENKRRHGDVYLVEDGTPAPKRANYEHRNDGKCKICDAGHHEHADCLKLQRVSKRRRRALVGSLSLCYGCLREGHCARLCRSQEKCEKCSYCHHDLLPCYEGRREDNRNKTAAVNYSSGNKNDSRHVEDSQNKA